MQWSRWFVAVIVLVCFLCRNVCANIWPAKADVVFVLDSSNEVGSADYAELQSMLRHLVRQWTIGPNDIQVGVVSYGNGAHNEFFFSEALNISQLESHLQAMTFKGGTADADQAVKYATQTAFSQQHGARTNVPHIIIHITNGPSTSPNSLLQEAQNAHNEGVLIFNVGVGEGVQLDQLAKIASDPSNRYVLQADTYSSLQGLVPALSSRITNEIPVSVFELPQPTSCLRKADVALLIDSSSSVGQEDFEHLDDFVKDLIMQLPIAPDQVQLAALQFSGHPSLEFPFSLYSNRLDTMKAVESMQFMGGGTNTADAIRYVADNVFTINAGARYDVPRIAIVITDGQSVDPERTLEAAEAARRNHITLLAVGVGSNVNQFEINTIANDPDALNTFKVNNYKNLTTVLSSILDAACKASSMITSAPTPPAGVSTTEDPCKDQLANCYDYSENTCRDYDPWARKHCPRRCGYCSTAQPATCNNVANNCDSYGPDMCNSTQYRQWAYTNCKRYCGYCDSGVPSLGFYGKCLYKGLEYVQSEKWDDGCDYQCVCENAVRGYYRCYNKCPVYHDLPLECTLVGVPGECCLKPVCNFNQRIISNTVVSGPQYNYQHIPVCVHETKLYYQDQTWEVGCDLKCVCVNATSGSYKCQSYCPQYSSLPSQCSLVQKAGECCRLPLCEFNTQTGSFTGFGTLSGQGTEMAVGSRPVCEDAIVDCESYGTKVCTEYASWAHVNCNKFCSFCSTDTATPGPNDACYYRGARYSQGDKWKVSCGTECVCEDAVYGYYRCYNSCPSYLNLPSSCTAVQKTGECCPSVECSFGTYYPSSTNVLSIGNGGSLFVRGADGTSVDIVPTLPSGSTVPPGTFGGTVGLGNVRLDGCLFNGRMFIQGQIWHDACHYTCSCQDAAIGLISCRERCPKYDNVPASCTLIPDTNDPCCTVPTCPPSVTYVAVPLYSKGAQSIGSVITPSIQELVSGLYTARYTFIYSAFTVAPPTAPGDTLRPGGLDYCEYKGQRYSHGQRWEDGCDYNCVCEDASTGSWRCVEKCERYIEIPLVYCHLERDPTNPCCMRPICDFLVAHNEIAGNNTPTTTTLKPTTPHYFEPQCVYKGVEYAKGQTWYDGCDSKCTCDNAKDNTYTCLTRCPSYSSDYDSCPQGTDPDDPMCCRVPLCMPTTPEPLTPLPGHTLAPTLAPVLVPHIPPGILTGGNSTGMCVYKGVQYKQDDKWEDGCSYHCVCQDAQTGVYQCTEKCVRFGAVPANCRMVTDFRNPCCNIPSCGGTGVIISGTSLPGQSTPSPTSVCVYNGVTFQQGQVWEEGCSKICRCEDATNELYVCSDRCPSYDLPPECTLVTDPLDPCCRIPKCVPEAINSTQTPVPGLIPTLAPGKVTGSATYPTPTQSGNGTIPGTGLGINFCIYKGVPYSGGATWQDGCGYNCQCVDPSTGHYQCTERCTRYTALQPTCILIQDTSDPCCQIPVCSPEFSTPTPIQIGTPGAGTTLTPIPTQPGVTPRSGTTRVPNPGTSTPVPTPSAIAVCVYKGSQYTQGQIWYDGCDYSCTCEDAQSGIYRCIDRCARFTDLPEECTLGPDPQDPGCCLRPLCDYVPIPNSTAGYLNLTLHPGVVTGGSVTPSPMPYLTPSPGPDGSTLAPPYAINVCLYKGRQYTLGQKWADGCMYDCECIDAVAGKYQCMEKCMTYSDIPAQCSLVTDPLDPCCKVVYCDPNKSTPIPSVTASPQPGVSQTPFVGPNGFTLAPPTMTTPRPARNRCVYKGVGYNTGQSWSDGCDWKCVCEDGPSNTFRCNQRCFTYPPLTNCRLVTDPDDSCCQVPYCSPVPQTTQAPQIPVTGPDGSTLAPPRTTSQPVLIPTGVPGVIVGTVHHTDPHNFTNTSKACIYNGNVYLQGERWDDGCDKNCVCLNETVGLYQCTERCIKYLSVPPNCQMMMDLNDTCCKTPVCRPTTDAPQPTGTTTTASPIPGVSTGAPTPTVSFTLQPKRKCLFKDQFYVEKQMWYDGCDRVCVCVDGDANYYTCSDRCRTYENVPAVCQMVASPEDPSCCLVPQCIPNPGIHGFTTPDPALTPLPTVFTNPPGVFTGIAPTPSPRPGYPTPLPRDACVYKGREYLEGQRWQDACEYNCVCLNATNGYFKCEQRCPTYPVVPSQCWLKADPNDFCCKQLLCDFTQTTPDPLSPIPLTTRIPDPNLHTTTAPVTPTIGETTPGVIPTPSYRPPTLAPPFTFCMYNGIAYRQGDTWHLGCEQSCVCEDSASNYYICADRCPSYPGLPSTCTYIVDPKDSCCQVPFCYTMPTAAPGMIPSQEPGRTTSAPLPIPTGVPGVIIGMPNTGTGNKGCLRGKLYNPGETWQDGCQYNCECLDTTGRYKCTERCTPYPQVPGYCTMVPDPQDSCCTVPQCPNPFTLSPHPGTTLIPNPTGTGSTVSPIPGQTPVTEKPTQPTFPVPKDVCLYKGRSYTEGQIWYDGCDYSCVCENAKTGFFRCSDRCATFTNIPALCKLVPDIRDATCCMVPECEDPSLLNVTGHIGTITGYGKPPTPQATLEPITGGPGVFVPTPLPNAEVCIYNGRAYSQGQRWQDGCNYNCECVEATIGRYQCTDRCPRYGQNIMSFCVMLRNPLDPCCSIPDCTVTPIQPGATGSPTMGPPFPTLTPTRSPGREFCVYHGIPYTLGQQWTDGCDKTCRCEDAVTGQINCDDRCPTYSNVQIGCVLVTDPSDHCCQVPQCPTVPSVNHTLTVTGPTGTITGSSLPHTTGPLTRNVCVYHGKVYQQNEVWDDGCTYSCSCVDASAGKYMCVERCQRIVNMPPTCSMVQDKTDHCCLIPYCLPWVEGPTPEPPGLTPTSMIPNPTHSTGQTPALGETTPSGQTPSPGHTQTPSPSATPGPLPVCSYKGEGYRQGQQWFDNCDVVCSCENSTMGSYRCQQRCKTYNPAPGCMMVPDPSDPSCCEIPHCPFLTPSPSPVDPSVSPTPGIINIIFQPPGTIVGQGRVPTPDPHTLVTGPDGSTINPTYVPRIGCYYKGVIYQALEKWDDGCDYSCQCDDEIIGRYTCTSKCPILPELPVDRCMLVQDPNHPCCMTPYCDFVNPTPFPNGTPNPYPTPGPSAMTLAPGQTPPHLFTPTPAPTASLIGMCVYNGAYYSQGQSWTIGCDSLCACEDATTGFFSCRQRCKTFGAMTGDCELRVDPSDACCLVPYCPQPLNTITPLTPTGIVGSSTPAPYYILTGTHKGSFTGGGRPPLTFGTSTGFTNGCIYKTSLYNQNQIWEDACDYLCVCMDAIRGQYSCEDRCPTFYFMPPTCVLEQDPDDMCCQRAKCYPGGLTPTPPQIITATGSGFTGTGTTPNPHVSITSFTGNGTAVVTPQTPGGFTGTGTTQNPQVTGSVTSITGTGTMVVTPLTPSGFTGTGTTQNPLVTGSVTNVTGTGTMIITPPTPSGLTTQNPNVTVNPLTPTGFTGHGTTVIPQVNVTGSRGACIYQGVQYHTGDSWHDGCELTCRCVDDTKGMYTCTYRCPVYSSLPYYCHLQLDPSNICCKKPVCTIQGMTLTPNIGGTPTRSPTLEPSITNVIPLGTHTVITGSSRVPGGATEIIYGGRATCLYKGVEYIPGESWDDSCDFTCTCIGNDNGLYRCVSKCPSYPALPSYCSLNSIPGQCCASLSCLIPNINQTYNPFPQLEPNPKPTAGPNGIFPTPEPTLDPQLILGSLGNITGGTGLPGGGFPVPSGYLNNLGGITDKCIYDLKLYNQGEMWEVNCTYTCHCLDSRTGYYRCTQRCPSYDLTRFPSTCTMVADPTDNCCSTPSCPNPNNPNITITNITLIQSLYPVIGHYSGGISGFRPGWIPTGSFTSIGGVRDGCAYKGMLYKQGAHWEDGCEFDCDCIDGTVGMFQCTAKCVAYSVLPPMCRMVDVEGDCCQTVHCDPVTTPVPECRDKIDNCYQYREQACHGAYEPWAHEHCPLFCGFCKPAFTTTEPPCVDVEPHCDRYGQTVCESIAYEDWVMKNCRNFCGRCGTTTKATTVWTTPESGCYDAIPYCAEYGMSICSDIMYKGWVLDNCQKYCSICGGSIGSTTEEPCIDVLGTETCQLYGHNSCVGQYFGWARANCRKFCDICGQVTQAVHSSVGTTGPGCVDRLDNCAAYGRQYCGGDYLAWAADNCPNFCNLCHYELTTVQIVQDNGWLVLLKGVAGLPGHIWQLWSTTATANMNVLQAQYLTNQYPGHYKPEITNQWDLCQFERVKVAIYSGGVEKANIVFDVRHSGKNDWYRPENVVSSTFLDLPTVDSNFITQDPATGHEFAIGDFSDCHGTGWLFISTNRNCSYQSGTAPQFLYSLSNTVSHLEPTQLGHGDVFAVLGQGGNCMSGVLTTKRGFTGANSGCFYKGVTYNVGQTWQDGCELNCTCQDAVGQYHCVQQCPTYQNLPQECTLEKPQPEACCAELKCPFPTGEGCYYKNQSYTEGAKWQDGCDFDCTCVDGRTGSYHCTQICQDWTHLPAQCHMDAPDPGLCCPRPVCPPPIVVDFTPR